MQSFKIYQVKSSMVTDYIIEMEDGRNIYMLEAVPDLSASGMKTYTARMFNKLREVPPDSPVFRQAIELYKKRLEEVTLMEVLK